MGTSAALAQPAKAAAQSIPANSHEREAAERLGRIYLGLSRLRATPLGPWAIAPEKGRGVLHGPFYAVLGMVYGTDTERERKFGRAHYQSRFTLYKRDYDAVVPKLLEAVLSYATLALNAEVTALASLWNQLTTDQKLANSLHVASEEILRRRVSKEFGAALEEDMRKLAAARTGSRAPTETRATLPKSGYSYVSPNEYKQLVRNRIAKEVRYAGNNTLSVLFEHPDGMAILEAYAQSAGKGTVESIIRVLRAINSVEKFARKIVQERHALRYPFFLVGGVAVRCGGRWLSRFGLLRTRRARNTGSDIRGGRLGLCGDGPRLDVYA